MAALASHLPVNKSSHRLKPTGLKVKTSCVEAGRYTNGKAKAIRSADWRNPTTGSSSKGRADNHRASEGHGEPRTSSDMSSPLLIEIPDLNRGSVRYRRPKSEQTPWEMISSAPVAQSRLTQSELLDLCMADITNVEFKDVKPVVVNVNGEEIALPNRFTFDITPINLSESSSENSLLRTVGRLKRVQDPSQLRTKSSKRSTIFSELPDDLNALLSHDLNRIPEETSASPVGDTNSSTGSVIRRKVSSQNKPSQVTTSKLVVRENPRHKCSKLTDEDKIRFQGLLDRLQKKEKSPVGKPAMSAFDVRSSDPAILAAKVKEQTVTIRSLRNNESTTEILESVHQPHTSRLQRSENSRDSGYGTGPGSQGTDTHSVSTRDATTALLPKQQDNTKKLNPAAAEFKSTGETIDMPFLIPKRLSRPPLTESLFEAPGVATAQQISTPVRPPPGFGPLVSDGMNMQTQLPPPPEPAPHGNGQHVQIPAATLTNLPPLGQLDPRTSEIAPLPGLLPGSLPGVYPPSDWLARPFNMNPAIHYSALMPSVPGPANNFGTVSTNPFNHFPIPGPQMGLTNMNPFGTFPPPDVALPFVPPPPNFGRNPTAPGPPRPAPLPVLGERPPPPPLFGVDGKPIRPHFPVTQKPRDHDPVKQQQYEAYLEWRKANEPGYHIRCKMRQANRIVRQHQMKQAEQNQAEQKGVAKGNEKTENPAWKSIVEKAKAVVANAAAAAAAEKRSRGESVKEEFKAKIQETCGDLINLGQQGPAKEQVEVRNEDKMNEEK